VKRGESSTPSASPQLLQENLRVIQKQGEGRKDIALKQQQTIPPSGDGANDRPHASRRRGFGASHFHAKPLVAQESRVTNISSNNRFWDWIRSCILIGVRGSGFGLSSTISFIGNGHSA